MKKLGMKNLLVILISALINVWVWYDRSPAGVAFFCAAYGVMSGTGKLLLAVAVLIEMAYALPIIAFIKYAGLMITVMAMAAVLGRVLKRYRLSASVMYGLMMLAMLTSDIGYVVAFGESIRAYLGVGWFHILSGYAIATGVYWLTVGCMALINGWRPVLKRRMDMSETTMVTKNQLHAFSESFKKLSESFEVDVQPRTSLNQQEMQDIFNAVTEQVCSDCSRCEYCWENVFEDSCESAYEILSQCEVKSEMKKKDLPERFRQRCVRSDNFLAEARRMIGLAQTNLSWQNRLAQSRLAVAGQFGEVADVIGNFSKQIADEPVKQGTPEKQAAKKLESQNIHVRQVAASNQQNGRQCVYIEARTQKNDERPVQQAADIISRVYGRRYLPMPQTAAIISHQWQMLAFEEDVHYRTIIGDARMIRMGEMVSGDSFTVMHMDSGQVVMSLSDGMGSGEKAEKESNRMISLLEQLLTTGFNRQSAIRLIHSVILAAGKPHTYSTLDLSVLDLFNGSCEIVKMGAAVSFIKNGDHVSMVASSALPPGALPEPEDEAQIVSLRHGDMLVMMSDGVLNALGDSDNEEKMTGFLEKTNIVSPQELANAILNHAMASSGYQAEDDMTVLVCGLYQKS